MTDWKLFSQSYRLIEIRSDDDLLFQAGLTVNGRVISRECFDAICQSITKGLDLNTSDILLDLCCGNGVITYQLSKLVGEVIGIDFSSPNIDNARKFKSSKNITYIVHDAAELMDLDLPKVTKVLLYGSLAYFSPVQFKKILLALDQIGDKDVTIFLGSVLDRTKIWSFFNTARRKATYLIIHRLLRKDPGIGRWWRKSEIRAIAGKNGFECEFVSQNPILHTAHYRFDVILRRKGSARASECRRT